MSGYVNYCKYINKVLIINLFCTAFNFTGEPWAVNQRRSLSSQEGRSRLRSSLWFYLGRKWIVCIKNIRHYHESLSLSLKPRSLSTDYGCPGYLKLQASWLLTSATFTPFLKTQAHLCIFHQHVLSRDAHMLQLKVTVVHRIKSKLWSNVPDHDTWAGGKGKPSKE